jgi:hypothetical protein
MMETGCTVTMDKKTETIIRSEIEPIIHIIVDKSDSILDSKTLEEAEEFHRRISYLSVEDLLEPFTI